MSEARLVEELAFLLAKKDATGRIYVGASTRNRAAKMIRDLAAKGYRLTPAAAPAPSDTGDMGPIRRYAAAPADDHTHDFRGTPTRCTYPGCMAAAPVEGLDEIALNAIRYRAAEGHGFAVEDRAWLLRYIARAALARHESGDDPISDARQPEDGPPPGRWPR